MKQALALLATTQNYNRGNPEAAKRIAEIYQLLKENPTPEETDRLLLEALKLKKTPRSEIEKLLAPHFQLFCFPYAGGSKGVYETWQEHLPASIRIHPIEYPGRGTKSQEKLTSNLEQLLTYLEQEIVHEIKGPFAFFGHSLGAILAFELAVILHNKYHRSPKALFLSGSPPPDKTSSFSSIREQDDSTFIQTLQKLNGIPPSLLTSQAFRDFFLPILRNDFSLTDGYDRKREKVSTPLILFGSDQDPIVSLSDMQKWAEWSEHKIELHQMQGDHFFVHEPKQILQQIEKKLCPL